jgi:hypothetical protein
MCAVVRLRALMARQAARLITNPPIASFPFASAIENAFVPSGTGSSLSSPSKVKIAQTMFSFPILQEIHKAEA